MYGAFSIVIFEQGWGIPTEDIEQELFFIMIMNQFVDGVAQGKYGLWTNKKDVNRPVVLHK